ncbi:MAG: NusA N-terminal domain-containing protein, partial [Verrucomicrobiota bacterium]
MSHEILSVLEYMEKEKGIGRDDMITTIAAAIKNAAQRGANVGQELKIEINPRTGALKAWKLLRIVDSVSDPALEIHISKASEWVEDPK